MILVQGRGQPIQKGWTSKALTDWFNNRDYEDPLVSNKSGLLKALEAFTGPFETSEALTGSLEAPFPIFLTPDVARYTQKNMDHLFQMFFQAKGGSGDKLKAKTLDVNRGRSYMECYNFCQQCKNYFATCGATGPNQILFAASFLRDRINFC